MVDDEKARQDIRDMLFSPPGGRRARPFWVRALDERDAALLSLGAARALQKKAGTASAARRTAVADAGWYGPMKRYFGNVANGMQKTKAMWLALEEHAEATGRAATADPKTFRSARKRYENNMRARTR